MAAAACGRCAGWCASCASRCAGRAAPSARGRGCARRWSPAAAPVPAAVVLDVEFGRRADPQVGAEQGAGLADPRRGSRSRPPRSARSLPPARTAALSTVGIHLERGIAAGYSAAPVALIFGPTGAGSIAWVSDSIDSQPIPSCPSSCSARTSGRQTHSEMIASENFCRRRCSKRSARCSPTSTPRAIPVVATTGAARRSTSPRAGDLARQGAVRRRARQRPGPLRAPANNAVYMALLEPGDTFLGLALDPAATSATG